jgi:hypothetical protein
MAGIARRKIVMSSIQPTFFQGPVEKSERAQLLGYVSWALFFIWAGVSILAALTWGWFLLGVGLLVVAAQLARWQMGMAIEGFWVGCGIVFLAAGIWSVLDLPWPLSAVMLIALGAVLLGKVFVAVRR